MLVIDPDQLDAIRSDVGRHLKSVTKQNEGERQRQSERLKQLDAESRKLMQALYNDSIPMDCSKKNKPGSHGTRWRRERSWTR